MTTRSRENDTERLFRTGEQQQLNYINEDVLLFHDYDEELHILA